MKELLDPGPGLRIEALGWLRLRQLQIHRLGALHNGGDIHAAGGARRLRSVAGSRVLPGPHPHC